MPDNVILLLFLGLIFGVIWGILFTLLAKYLKWEIRIRLVKRNYSYGEKINWTFKLHAKKEIIGQELEVHLVAYRRESSYSKDGKRQTRRVEFARYSHCVESGVVYEAWLRRDYDISIQVPSRENIFWTQSELDLWDSALWKIASYALRSTRKNQLTWQLQVDLQAEWLDLHGKKDIFVTD